MARVRVFDTEQDGEEVGESALASPDYLIDGSPATFSSGCTALDCSLGGGWPLNRMFNIMGDKSTGKTLLAIEACAQFLRLYGRDADIHYIETEAAFDAAYAAALGLQTGRIHFPPSPRTVEDLESLLLKIIAGTKGRPTLAIVDSYDALSDDAEMKREASDKATFGTAKAKQSSTMFRKLIKSLADAKVTLGIVSQVRQNIGVVFGAQYVRSGGKALDFYATHIVYLQRKKQLKRTREKIERVVGVLVNAKVEKNKISMPHRDVEFPLIFGYGVEDVVSMVDWLVQNSRFQDLFDSEAQAARFLNSLGKMSDDVYREEHEKIRSVFIGEWKAVERLFQPPRVKY